ncbi:MAG: hypothetical protein IIA49_14325 [Bacteroidetes bacterium]|nr:hypothetical protein [Bacteroidota bacterium]
MKISLIDKSNYLKGLLILSRKDNHISEIQKSIILKAGKSLGFSSEFCEEILKTILENECLSNDPIKFEKYEVAKSFIQDGLKLSCSGKLIIKAELNWLRNSAIINSIDLKWFEDQVSISKFMINNPVPTQLTLYSII